MAKNYVSIEKLGTYDKKIKEYLKNADDAILEKAKAHAEELSENYDPAGSSVTAETNAKAYTDEKIGAVNTEVASVKTTAEKGVADAAAADAKAVKAQGDVDALKTYVGTIPEGTDATDVIGYVNKKTEGIATDTALAELQGAVDAVEDAVGAIEADYLKAADKTELEGKITKAQGAADAAQSHSEGVASDLASAKADLEAADTAQIGRIAALEGKITGLTGAMHFKGTEDELPEDVSSYAEGDVIIVGEKEYVFNGTEFKEFGDVSAEGQRIATLEGEMDAVEADVTQAKTDIKANADAVAKKVEQTAFDAKVATLEGADSALDTRLKTVEGAIGTSGSVATDIATAKSEAIEAAATDATEKANKALTDAKAYTDTEVGKDRTRLDALEADTHTHANKDLLDTYTQTEANLADAVAKKHAHANATVLDGISAENVTAWNKVEAKADATALTDEMNRAKAAEEANAAAIADFQECSEADILGLFA